MDVSLRPLARADLTLYPAWLTAVDAEHYMSRFYPRCWNGGDPIQVPDTAWYAILAGGEAAGSVWVEAEEGEPGAARLGILIRRPDLLGRGIGRRTIALAIAQARPRLGFGCVRLNVRQDNARTIACYRACGLTVVGQHVKQGEAGPVPYLVMELICRPDATSPWILDDSVASGIPSAGGRCAS